MAYVEVSGYGRELEVLVGCKAQESDEGLLDDVDLGPFWQVKSWGLKYNDGVRVFNRVQYKINCTILRRNAMAS